MKTRCRRGFGLRVVLIVVGGVVLAGCPLNHADHPIVRQCVPGSRKLDGALCPPADGNPDGGR
jgi:hypothetical protein